MSESKSLRIEEKRRNKHYCLVCFKNISRLLSAKLVPHSLELISQVKIASRPNLVIKQIKSIFTLYTKIKLDF
jgi:hypothetical protein